MKKNWVDLLKYRGKNATNILRIDGVVKKFGRKFRKVRNLDSKYFIFTLLWNHTCTYTNHEEV